MSQVAETQTPDQHDQGTNSGFNWSVTRYGTLVVMTCDLGSDDVQYATEADAIEGYKDLVECWHEGPVF